MCSAHGGPTGHFVAVIPIKKVCKACKIGAGVVCCAASEDLVLIKSASVVSGPFFHPQLLTAYAYRAPPLRLGISNGRPGQSTARPSLWLIRQGWGSDMSLALTTSHAKCPCGVSRFCRMMIMHRTLERRGCERPSWVGARGALCRVTRVVSFPPPWLHGWYLRNAMLPLGWLRDRRFVTHDYPISQKPSPARFLQRTEWSKWKLASPHQLSHPQCFRDPALPCLRT